MDVNMALDQYFERNDSIIRAGGSKRREGHVMLATNSVAGAYLESLTTRTVTFEVAEYTVKRLEFATESELCEWLPKQTELDLILEAFAAYHEKSDAILESEKTLWETRISVNPIGVRWAYYDRDSVGGGQWVHCYVTTNHFFELLGKIVCDYRADIQEWEAEHIEEALNQEADGTQLIDIVDEAYADVLKDFKLHFDYVDFTPTNIKAIAQKLEAMQA